MRHNSTTCGAGAVVERGATAHTADEVDDDSSADEAREYGESENGDGVSIPVVDANDCEKLRM